MLEKLIMAIVLTLTLNWFLRVNQEHPQVNTSSQASANLIL